MITMYIIPAFRSIANTLVHMLIAINLYVIWSFAVKFEYQNHVLFSVIGYQFLLMEGALSMSEVNVWSNLLPKYIRKMVHITFQLLGLLSITVGFSLIVSEKRDHFRTSHGICGLIAFILSLSSLLFGIMSYFAPIFSRIRPTPLKAIHTVLGCLTLIMGLVTMCIGVNKSQFIFLTSKNVSICVTIFIVITMIYSLINPIIINMKTYIDNMRTTTL